MSPCEYAPLAVFVFNRPEHTRRLLASLEKNSECAGTKVYFFADAARKDSDIPLCEEVLKVVAEYREKGIFAETYLTRNTENKGLAESILSGVTKVLDEHGRIIVLEDDLIVGRDFLDYMNRGLQSFEKDETVWSVTGYTFPMKALEKYDGDIYLSDRGCSWGWATWKDRWDSVDWDVADYASFKFDGKARRAFARWGGDLPNLLDAYICGEIRSWAIRWCYSAFKQGKKTVYPKESRVINGGADGSGTNFHTAVSTYDTGLYNGDTPCDFTRVGDSEALRRDFSRKYTHGVHFVKLKTRWFLIRHGLMKPQPKK